MERFLADKQCNYRTKLPTNCNKIDLTLKLSPCGENAEERRLTRSSSVVENGTLWGPFVPSLDRSWSLPAEAEKGLMKFAESVAGKCPLVSTQMLALVAASAVKTPALACANDKLKAHGDSQLEGCLAEGGVGSNMQTSTKEENYSVVSRKTMAKEIQPENPPKKLKLGNYCSLKGDVMEILRQMPSVSTTGDGTNGKRIEGFLYKYRSGQVCIVCVCHGSFLTPAEFVMHAGGKEVVNPMKHITVYSNDSF